MDSTGDSPLAAQTDPPPRAFTQGAGTVFQFTGVMMFLAFFSVCALSSLLSKETAMQTHLGTVGWGNYSGQRAMSIGMAIGVFLGIALAGIGLGLQAQRRASPIMAMVVCISATVYWLIHVVFFAQAAHSILFTLICLSLVIAFASLSVLAVNAWIEMKKNPPPKGFEILPIDYKIPYSHMNQDPPEIRLARELDQRREKLAVQQKELEMLEQKLHRKLKEKDE